MGGSPQPSICSSLEQLTHPFTDSPIPALVSTHPFIHSFIHSTTYLSLHLSIHSFAHLSVDLIIPQELVSVSYVSGQVSRETMICTCYLPVRRLKVQ